MHVGHTFGACTIASVSYIGACTTLQGDTVYLETLRELLCIGKIPTKLIYNYKNEVLYHISGAVSFICFTKYVFYGYEV